MKRSAWCLGFAFLTAAGMSGCIHKPLVNPEVQVPPGASQDQVKQHIRQALAHYEWVIDEEKPGATAAHLQQGKLFARVRVDYDQNKATVRYLESKNIYYSKEPSGQEYIHSRYLVWAGNIAEQLDQALNPKPDAVRQKKP